MKLNSAFGIILRKLRLEKNFSQVELADASGLDRTFISLLERGIRQPSLSSLFQLAMSMGIKPSEIVRQVEARARRSRWPRMRNQ